MPKFIIQKDYKITGEYVIAEGTAVIGRGEADLNLDHGGVSRRHCRINYSDGRVTIEDLGSVNGTFVNGELLTNAVVLKHGDCIQLGEMMLSFDASDLKNSNELTGSVNSIADVQKVFERVAGNIRCVIQGKDEVIRNVLIALMGEGHVLLEDVPGTGKTRLAQALARSIRTEFKRIQFTPDMLPNDITGTSMYNEAGRNFIFSPGPVFANVVLADEINRGTPRVQSSLLECMSDAAVTVDGISHVLHRPFFVIATQNPVDFHGTYPLPEAQLDRFIMRLSLGYPDKETEKEILQIQAETNPLNSIFNVVEANDVLRCQALIHRVNVSERVRDYIATIIDCTRKHQALTYGCSTRAALALMHCAQSLAALNGRDYVMPRDVRELAAPVLAHRVPLKIQARAEWHTSEAVIKAIVAGLKIEKWEE